MGPDFDKYRPLVAELDLTDEEKDELIYTVWSMMRSFVEASFGEDPTQLAVDQNKNKFGHEAKNRVDYDEPDNDDLNESIEP